MYERFNNYVELYCIYDIQQWLYQTVWSYDHVNKLQHSTMKVGRTSLTYVRMSYLSIYQYCTYAIMLCPYLPYLLRVQYEGVQVKEKELSFFSKSPSLQVSPGRSWCRRIDDCSPPQFIRGSVRVCLCACYWTLEDESCMSEGNE